MTGFKTWSQSNADAWHAQAIQLAGIGLSRKEIAKRLGVHVTSVGLWLKQSGTPCADGRTTRHLKSDSSKEHQVLTVPQSGNIQGLLARVGGFDQARVLALWDAGTPLTSIVALYVGYEREIAKAITQRCQTLGLKCPRLAVAGLLDNLIDRYRNGESVRVLADAHGFTHSILTQAMASALGANWNSAQAEHALKAQAMPVGNPNLLPMPMGKSSWVSVHDIAQSLGLRSADVRNLAKAHALPFLVIKNVLRFEIPATILAIRALLGPDALEQKRRNILGKV